MSEVGSNCMRSVDRSAACIMTNGYISKDLENIEVKQRLISSNCMARL